MLNRQFKAKRPNEKWVTDVTEFNVKGEKLYLSPVMDLLNGEIVAYEMLERPLFPLVSNMLKKALARLTDRQAPLLHSDQGWHYHMRPYRQQLAERGLTQSMSRKGNCLDNAAMERFFGTLKSEFFRLNRFESIEQLRKGLHDYILQPPPAQAQTKRPEPGGVPNSGLELFAFNCPTSWGQFTNGCGFCFWYVVFRAVGSTFLPAHEQMIAMAKFSSVS